MDIVRRIVLIALAMVSLSWPVEAADRVPILINEFSTAEGWIELYNSGKTDVDPAGLYLKAGTSSPRLVAGGTRIPAGGHLLLRVYTDKEAHLKTFLIDDGEVAIDLIDADGKTVIDSVRCYRQGVDASEESFGRFPDGGDELDFMPPSPGAANQAHLDRFLPY